jgi:hypothetical protein
MLDWLPPALDRWARQPLTIGQIEQLAAAGTDAGGVEALNRAYDWRRSSVSGLSKGLAAASVSIFAGFLAETIKSLPAGAHRASAGAEAAVTGVAAGFATAALVAAAATSDLEDRYVADYWTLTFLQSFYPKPQP